MNKNTRILSIIAYLTWLLWIVAFVLHDRSDRVTRRHLNQALVLNICQTIVGIIYRLGGIFTIAGELISVAILVLAIMGIVRAVKLSDEPLPVVGDIHLIS